MYRKGLTVIHLLMPSNASKIHLPVLIIRCLRPTETHPAPSTYCSPHHATQGIPPMTRLPSQELLFVSAEFHHQRRQTRAASSNLHLGPPATMESYPDLLLILWT